METVGKIIEDILKYIKAEKGVKREDIKDKFELEEEKTEQILQFLVALNLIGMDKNEVFHVYKEVNTVELKLIGADNQIKITELGLEFLQL